MSICDAQYVMYKTSQKAVIIKTFFLQQLHFFLEDSLIVKKFKRPAFNSNKNLYLT